MLDTDNFIHQEKTRLFCDHDGARQKQDHSEIVSEPKQNKNMIHTIKNDQNTPSLPATTNDYFFINYSFLSITALFLASLRDKNY